MGDTSTLFDGFSDSDESAAVPNSKAKPAEPEKSESPIMSKMVTANHPISQKSIQGVDPFDINNFNTSKSEIELPMGAHFVQINSMKLKTEKIIDHAGEIAKLRDELRIKNEEINRLSSQLHQKAANASMMDMEDTLQSSFYHLAFMFSSPLVRKINSNLEIIMQLDYINEIKNIEKGLKHVKHEVKYKVDVATVDKFRSVITDAPFALHFTGHGVRNDKNALGSAYEQHKERGDILLLEDDKGMADYLFESDLRTLVQISKAHRAHMNNYEVVFVSSCYSEFTAKVFLASGARHVICIRGNQTISDKASLRFSQVFYETLFVK